MNRRTILGLLGLSAMPRLTAAPAVSTTPVSAAIQAMASATHELDALIPFLIEELSTLRIGRLERRSEHSTRVPTWSCAVGRGMHELHANVTLITEASDERPVQLRLNTETGEVMLHTWTEYFPETISGNWERHRFDPMSLVRKRKEGAA